MIPTPWGYLLTAVLALICRSSFPNYSLRTNYITTGTVCLVGLGAAHNLRDLVICLLLVLYLLARATKVWFGWFSIFEIFSLKLLHFQWALQGSKPFGDAMVEPNLPALGAIYRYKAVAAVYTVTHFQYLHTDTYRLWGKPTGQYFAYDAACELAHILIRHRHYLPDMEECLRLTRKCKKLYGLTYENAANAVSEGLARTLQERTRN